MKNKPWAILKVTRREYEIARPWVRANMERKKFEELLELLPEGFVDLCHLEAAADKLVASIFGPEASKE